MRILFCNAVYLVIVCAALFVAGSVLWHELVQLHPFDLAEPDEDDEPPVEDATAAWDRAHDQFVDRETGVS